MREEVIGFWRNDTATVHLKNIIGRGGEIIGKSVTHTSNGKTTTVSSRYDSLFELSDLREGYVDDPTEDFSDIYDITMNGFDLINVGDETNDDMAMLLEYVGYTGYVNVFVNYCQFLQHLNEFLTSEILDFKMDVYDHESLCNEIYNDVMWLKDVLKIVVDTTRKQIGLIGAY